MSEAKRASLEDSSDGSREMAAAGYIETTKLILLFRSICLARLDRLDRLDRLCFNKITPRFARRSILEQTSQ